MERLLYAFLTVASTLAPLGDWGQGHWASIPLRL